MGEGLREEGVPQGPCHGGACPPCSSWTLLNLIEDPMTKDDPISFFFACP